MYIVPQLYKCPKCGYECQYGPHDKHPAPIVGADPVCPKCWALFLHANVGLMESTVWPTQKTAKPFVDQTVPASPVDLPTPIKTQLFQRRPVKVKATQWLKLGDHPAVTSIPSQLMWRNGRVIDPKTCGYLHTLGKVGNQIVCPTDWIVEPTSGEYVLLTDAQFRQDYLI